MKSCNTKKLSKIKLTINEEYHEYPIIKYLKQIQPQWTKIFAIKMIRTKNVIVNGKKTSIQYKLQKEDLVEIYGSNNQTFAFQTSNLKKLKPLNVVYENEKVIIVNKERGIAVQSDQKHSFNNMNNRLLNHLTFESNNASWKPCFIHRLDYNTTGLLIGAKKYIAYKELSEAIKKREIKKYYKALVLGIVKFKEKTINNYLLKKQDKVYNSENKIPKSKEAITKIKLIKHDFENKNSLLEIELITGRTHQIRTHLAYIGHPIRGDSKYGIERDKKYPYPCLIAWKLMFSKDIKGESIKNLAGKTFEIKGEKFN